MTGRGGNWRLNGVRVIPPSSVGPQHPADAGDEPLGGDHATRGSVRDVCGPGRW